jgi:hypothetical protein
MTGGTDGPIFAVLSWAVRQGLGSVQFSHARRYCTVVTLHLAGAEPH